MHKYEYDSFTKETKLATEPLRVPKGKREKTIRLLLIQEIKETNAERPQSGMGKKVNSHYVVIPGAHESS